MAERAEADAVAEIARKSVDVRLLSLGPAPGVAGAPLVSVIAQPPGVQVTSIKELLDEYRQAPERRAGTATLTTLASFIDHAKRFADAGSALFANDDATEPELVSVLDYHPATPNNTDARFAEHRGVYTFPLSDEWKAWTSRSGAWQTQDDFARFLEDRIVDVLDPSTALATAKDISAKVGATFAGPSRLLELSTNLEIRIASKVGKAIKLSSGETKITYQTEHLDEASQPLVVPSLFLIGIPIFVAGDLYQISTRLRYKVDGGNIRWSYELVQPGRAFRDAVGLAAQKAADETKLPLFFGSPEAE